MELVSVRGGVDKPSQAPYGIMPITDRPAAISYPVSENLTLLDQVKDCLVNIASRHETRYQHFVISLHDLYKKTALACVLLGPDYVGAAKASLMASLVNTFETDNISFGVSLDSMGVFCHRRAK